MHALHPYAPVVVGGSRAELTFTVECGSWEGAMSEINRSGKMSVLGSVPSMRRRSGCTGDPQESCLKESGLFAAVETFE